MSHHCQQDSQQRHHQGTHSPTHLLTHLLTYLLTYSLTHLLTYSLTHLLTHSPTHLLTYSPTHLVIKIWDSVSQFICAIVSIYYKESSEFRGNVPSILKLLKVMCMKQAQEVVLINCAVIVSYISIIIPEFTQEIDNIVRTILQLSDHEKVLESISITLYNYSCYSKSESDRDDTTTPSSSVKALLKDSYYLNIMVRMMRKGNNDVQLNIANAIMNMAAIPRCTVLLKESNSNILSDLVVIALLRTSSMSIKRVCAQVFYNMLCHDETRTRLVASEFWWGICRLCRTDDLMIRNLFAKIMFECSLHAG